MRKNLVKSLRRLSPYKEKEVEHIIGVWENDWSQWKTWSEIYKSLEWHEQKLARWLKRLRECGILFRKREGRHAYYRLNPGQLHLMLGVLRLDYLEKIIKKRLTAEVGVFTISFPQNTMLAGSFGNMNGAWLDFYPTPFWENAIDITVIGAPKEEDLLPIERVIFNHIIRKLKTYFHWLAWLRTKQLARKLLNIQLPLENDLKRVLFELKVEETFIGRKDALKEAGSLLKLRPKKLLRSTRKIYKDIHLPKPSLDVNQWKLLKKLREKGYANNLAVMLTSGPSKTMLTEHKLWIRTQLEGGIPLPPLSFPEKDISNECHRILIEINKPPKLSIYNPSLFEVKPRMMTNVYKYTIEEEKDPEKVKKLKKGELPSTHFYVYKFDELIRELETKKAHAKETFRE